MANKKITKRALFGSVMALVLCCAMLVGSTFAWFTDSANTAVSSVKSGTLDVDLVYVDGEASVVGTTLNFIKAGNSTEILWEPGCTYVLPAIKVVNKGNLALKYKLEVTGVNGDAKLLEAIEWTLNEQNLMEHTGNLLPEASSESLTIKGHMKESAGNEYQGLSLEGIAITLVATQDTVEYDSFDNQYDAQAEVYTVDDLADVESGVIDLLDDTYTMNFMAPKAGFVGTIQNGTLNNGVNGDYAVVLKGGEVALSNLDINSQDGGIGATDGAKVTVNADVDVSSKNTSGRYNVYAVGEGTEVTIIDGNFSFSKTLNQKRAYIYAGAGTTVYVKGGNFGAASTRDGYTAGILGDGTVIITGGTFGFNPSKWVAEGYQAVQNSDNTWTVSAK